jgi:uncharacterized membrane protein
MRLRKLFKPARLSRGMKNQAKIIGAIIGAIIFYFLTVLFANMGFSVLPIIFVILGAIAGYFAVPNKKSHVKSFFSPTFAKIAWTFILLILTFVMAFAFMDRIDIFAKIIGSILNPLNAIILFYFVNFTSQGYWDQSGWSANMSAVYSIINILSVILWDYFLVCLSVWIFSHLKSKKK